jgi:hypothetical protein
MRKRDELVEDLKPALDTIETYVNRLLAQLAEPDLLEDAGLRRIRQSVDEVLRREAVQIEIRFEETELRLLVAFTNQERSVRIVDGQKQTVATLEPWLETQAADEGTRRIIEEVAKYAFPRPTTSVPYVFLPIN